MELERPFLVANFQFQVRHTNTHAHKIKPFLETDKTFDANEEE
jgi:hypothetical protein